tara:strand:+ start:830 stop:3250 length:2421 start_codon:yes stop_codon:yes gene_type:complete
MANGNTKKNINDTKQAMDELLFATRDFTDEVQKSAKEVFGIGTQARAATKAFRDIANITREIDTDIDDILDGTKSIEDLTKSQLKLEQKKKNLTTEYRIALDKAGVSVKDISKIVKGEVALTDHLVENYADMSTENSNLLDLFEQQTQAIRDTEKELSGVAEKAKEIESNMGGTGTALKGLGGILKKTGLGDFADKMGIDDAVDSGRKLSASLGKGGSKAKVASHMVGKIGANLAKAFGPAALIAMAIDQIVKAFKQLDQLSGEVAKSMGVSAAEGESLVKSMNQAANSTGELDVSTKDLVKAQMEMNQMLGTSVEFSAEMAEEFSLIQQRTGLSTEAMSFFAKESLRAGTSMTDQLRTVSNVTEEMSAQTGINLSLKEIQEGVASASKATFLATKGGVEELTKAVFKARQFGITMSQLDSTASSLLDFESSIASELEAELLLGKDLNLEKARQAALDNDMATLSSEIAKNVGSAAEFQEMNRIQQEAIAKSVGMQREDLAGMLLEQENLAKIKDSDFKSMSEAQDYINKRFKEGITIEQARQELVGKGVNDTLTAQLLSQTRAEKMGKFQEKMGDLFMLLAEAFTPLIDELMEILPGLLKGLQPLFKALGFILSISMKFSMVFGGLVPLTKIIENTLTSIGNIFSPIVEYAKELFGVFKEGGLMAAFAYNNIERIGGLFKKVGKGIGDYFLAPIRAAAGYIAGIGSYLGFNTSSLSSFAEDSLSSPTPMASGGIVTGPTNAIIGEGGEPEAVVPLSKANSVGFGGNSETNSLLKELIGAVKAGGTVTLDGQKVGQALSISNYSTQ